MFILDASESLKVLYVEWYDTENMDMSSFVPLNVNYIAHFILSQTALQNTGTTTTTTTTK